jgi:phage gp46-like protein
MAGIDFKLDITNPTEPGFTFEKESTVINNIYLSIVVKKGSFFQNPTFGSLLHTIKKIVPTTPDLVIDYIKQALKWIQDIGRITSLDVISEIDNDVMNRVNFKISATQADGLIVTFSSFVAVV